MKRLFILSILITANAATAVVGINVSNKICDTRCQANSNVNNFLDSIINANST